MARVLQPSFVRMRSARYRLVPLKMALWPKASSWSAVETRSHKNAPSLFFTPSLTAMTTLE